jgi:GNAT superfamily N-acetyltransferase
MIDVRELKTDAEIAAAFPLMAELRPHLEREAFLEVVRRQQRDGYRLFGGFDGGALVVLAGARDAHTLARGPHLFVDDLVTLRTAQGRGHGTAMLRWLADHAAGRGFARIYLDSRAAALGFYQRVGFTAHTSVPCWIDVDRLGAARC